MIHLLAGIALVAIGRVQPVHAAATSGCRAAASAPAQEAAGRLLLAGAAPCAATAGERHAASSSPPRARAQGAAQDAQDPPPPAFAFPPASLAAPFGNVLGDRVLFASSDGALRGTGSIAGRDLQIDARGTADAFAGTARWGDAKELPCTGRIDGEVLALHLGESDWRLSMQVALDPTLVDLGEPVVDAAREWTVAIYLGGDNDLENAAIRDLLEMQAGMPATGCEVVVLLDRHKDDDDGEGEWSDTRVLRVRPGDDGNFESLGTPVERDTGDAGTLASFVAGVFRKYPAKRHAVFLWDHGGGWSGMCIDEDPPGAGAPRTMLGLDGVRVGLRTALQAAGLLRCDLLAFDACMMAQLDVALAVHDLADIMVASEAVVPGSGYPYTQFLARFGEGESGRDIARTIVNEYGSFSDDAFKSGSTLVAFDLRRAPAVAQRLDAVGRQALAASAAQWHAIARALFFAECYEPRADRVGDDAYGSIDLIDLSSRLRGIPGIDDDALDALQLSIAGLVQARYNGAERTLSKGLAIYGPHRQAQYDPGYDRTPLGLGNAWRPMLQRVHALAAADTSPIEVGEFVQQDALGAASTEARPFGGDRVRFAATGNAIVEVVERQWQYDAGGKNWLLLRAQLVTDPMWPARWATAAAADLVDLVMPQFQDGRNELYAELSGMTFAITDGTIQTYGSLDLARPSMQAPIAAIARFTAVASGEQTMVEVAFDRAEWDMVSLKAIGVLPGRAVPRTPVPVAGDRFEFWLATKAEDGTEGGMFTPALTFGEQGLSLVAEPDEPSRYRAEMIVRTMNGRTARAEHEYDVVANPDLATWPTSWQSYDAADPSPLVGTWKQFQVVGPGTYRDLATTAVVEATTAANVFRVTVEGGPANDRFETHQYWNFEWRGLPCLRIVTLVEDGQKFGWYGPVRRLERDGQQLLVMKAVNAVGAVWEWRKQ